MASSKRSTIRSTVLEFIAEHRIAMVDRDVLGAIERHCVRALGLPKTPSRRYLIDVLLDTDVEVHRQIGGIPRDLRGRVHVGSLEEARRSLLAMSKEYSATSDAVRRLDVRRAVLRAKERLQMGARRTKDPKRKAQQDRTLEWLLVWLENPPIFETWLSLVEDAKPSGHEDRRRSVGDSSQKGVE